ncbi:MAG TPA: SPOR domain-containing protein [Ignavibacteriaceae bacterium]|nr:SPOR domain-containing protein [Ignavibacteriaceae bacterium]
MQTFIYFLTIMIFGALIISSCTPSEETTKKEEVYVFDEIPSENTITPPVTGEYPTLAETYYVVQIGAFTTKERAESFADKSRQKLLNEISITYSERVSLYVVQIVPFYKSRQEAELVRDNLREISDFSDAWIITINK